MDNVPITKYEKIDNKDKTAIILSYFGWVGGDTTKVNLVDIRKDLGFNYDEINELLLFHQETSGLLRVEENTLSLTDKSIDIGNGLLLSLILKWGTLPFMEENQEFKLPQNYYLYPFLKYNNTIIFKNLKSKYILDFFHQILDIFAKNLEDITITEIYTPLRRFIIRLSLFPSVKFVIGHDPKIIEISEILKNKKLIKIQHNEIFDTDFILVKIEGLKRSRKNEKHKKNYRRTGKRKSSQQRSVNK